MKYLFNIIDMRNLFIAALIASCLSCGSSSSQNGNDTKDSTANSGSKDAPKPGSAVLDTARYDFLQKHIANGDTTGKWPVKHDYPLPGAILPFNRIVAYYGNIVNNRMGALGKWPKNEMIPRLLEEVDKWNKVDTVIKAIPALHYIAVTAQGAAGADGKWRYRLPHKHIDTVLAWAKEINAQVFIDVQVGLSDVQSEVPLFEKYLSMPNVHFGIDPEFAMKAKGNARPGSVIGSLDAADLNWISEYLAGLVRKHNLPPKIFMIHRFTKGMVTNASKIKLYPELQIVMDMDGWGPPDLKKGTYRHWIQNEPVQYTGFKLFYVNDTEKSGLKEMMKYEDILKLTPKPVYIQYQ
jgi:hypothetical protein